MKHGPYRLLFLDIDGTLVGAHDVVSPQTLDALRAAQEIGVTIVISTGRNPYMADRVSDQIGCSGFGIYSNGAVIRDNMSKAVLRKVASPKEAVEIAIEAAIQQNVAPLCFGAHVEVDGGEAVYTANRIPVLSAYAQSNSHRLRYLQSGEYGTIEPTFIEALGDQETVETIARLWQEQIGSHVIVHQARTLRFQYWSAHMYSAAVSKATAAQFVAERLNIPASHAIAIGDHLNDLELFQWAGLGICMGDGHEDARAAAGHITGSLADHGVAQAIEQFILST